MEYWMYYSCQPSLFPSLRYSADHSFSIFGPKGWHIRPLIEKSSLAVTQAMKSLWCMMCYSSCPTLLGAGAETASAIKFNVLSFLSRSLSLFRQAPGPRSKLNQRFWLNFSIVWTFFSFLFVVRAIGDIEFHSGTSLVKRKNYAQSVRGWMDLDSRRRWSVDDFLNV